MSCPRHWTRRNKWEKRGGGGTGRTMKIWYSRYGLACCLPSSGQLLKRYDRVDFSTPTRSYPPPLLGLRWCYLSSYCLSSVGKAEEGVDKKGAPTDGAFTPAWNAPISGSPPGMRTSLLEAQAKSPILRSFESWTCRTVRNGVSWLRPLSHLYSYHPSREAFLPLDPHAIFSKALMPLQTVRKQSHLMSLAGTGLRLGLATRPPTAQQRSSSVLLAAWCCWLFGVVGCLVLLPA